MSSYLGSVYSWCHRGAEGIFGLVQRATALTLLTNQRLNFFPSARRQLAQDRVSLLSESISGSIHPIKLKNSQGHLLDGILMVQEGALVRQESAIKVKGNLVVAYSGIGGCYESWYKEQLKELYTDFKVSVLMVNYRGVLESEGAVCQPEDLFDDGCSVARYAFRELMTEGGKLHLYGHSMGGAVAIHTAASLEKEGYPIATVCVDRSYGQLIENIQTALRVGTLQWLAHKVLRFSGWEIDSVRAIMKVTQAKVLLIQSPSDSVIPEETALATRLHESIIGKAPFAFLPLPHHGPSSLNIQNDPAFPYWAKAEIQESFFQRITRIMDFIHNGIDAHLVPFNKRRYPEQICVYVQLLKDKGD